MNVTSEILKLDVANLTFEELRQEYELSQWALAHALHKLGDCMTVTRADAEAFNKRVRVWYNYDTVQQSTTITILYAF